MNPPYFLKVPKIGFSITVDITHIHAQLHILFSKGVHELDKIHTTCVIHAYFAPSSHKNLYIYF